MKQKVEIFELDGRYSLVEKLKQLIDEGDIIVSVLEVTDNSWLVVYNAT
jgi:hypothetical protein